MAAGRPSREQKRGTRDRQPPKPNGGDNADASTHRDPPAFEHPRMVPDRCEAAEERLSLRVQNELDLTPSAQSGLIQNEPTRAVPWRCSPSRSTVTR
jgi:hypothetical protein